LLADFSELGSDSIELDRDSYYTRDSGTKNGEGGAFAGSDDLEGVRCEVLD